jgi:hypothetical protein
MRGGVSAEKLQPAAAYIWLINNMILVHVGDYSAIDPAWETLSKVFHPGNMPSAYLEEYLDTLTAIPQQVQHSLSKLAELDCYVTDGRTRLATALQALNDSPASPEARSEVQAALLRDIEQCAEKRAVADSLLESLERYLQQLEDDLEGFQDDLKTAHTDIDSNGPPKRSKTTTTTTATEEKREECVCGGKGRGEMVGCENPDCPSEWFHLQCVGLSKVPAGKWFCPECLRR